MKYRSGFGFWHDRGGGRKATKLQAARCGRMLAYNIRSMPASQPSTGLSFSEFPIETAEAFRSFAAFIGEEIERRDPETFVDFEVGLQKRRLGRAVSMSRTGTRTLARFTGGSPTSLPKRTLSVTFFRSPLAGKPVVLAGRRKPGPVRQVPHGSGGPQRSYAPVPLHADGRGHGWEARRPVASSVC